MSTSVNRAADYWVHTLKHDLVGFADPNTEIMVESKGLSIDACWSQRGRMQMETFS